MVVGNQNLNHRAPYGRKRIACTKNPTPKATRSKATDQAKATEQTKGREIQRNLPKQNPSKQDPPLEP